ncbi:hypothetical protein [Burkholderia sp. PR2]|uniref:hypothetical protein n=1 Tax=Burkholderia sp. PR2 TaxID=3448078 RepID=UPI00402AEDA8
MKKAAGYAIDAILIVGIVTFFYFVAFRREIHQSASTSNIRNAAFAITLASFAILPFRAKRPPSLLHFIQFDAKGRPRSNLAMPLMCFVLSILIVLALIRLIVIGFEQAAV